MKAPKKILLVESDKAMMELCLKILLDAGYLVETAPQGMDAAKRLEGATFDLVITGVNMPELDGIGLYLNALKHHSYLKDRFLFITGNNPVDRSARPVLLGMGRSFVRKPFEVKNLLRHVEELTRQPVEEVFEDELFDRRGMKRYEWVSECGVYYEAGTDDPVYIRANTVNISAGGLMIRYRGRPIGRGTPVTVHLEERGLSVAARVVSSRAIDEEGAAAALRFTEHIDVRKVTGRAKE